MVWCGADDREFQIVTLSADRTVKLEYILPSVLEVRKNLTILLHNTYPHPFLAIRKRAMFAVPQ